MCRWEEKWAHIKNEYAASPNVALKSTMITSVIEVYERRDMEIIYIPGSYLHTESDEK